MTETPPIPPAEVLAAIEAERNRQAKAKTMNFAPAIPPDDAFAEELAAAEQRLKDAWRSRNESSGETTERDAKVKDLLWSAHCPKRHLRKQWTDLDFTGDWGQKLTQVKGMIGKGFMAALVGLHGNGKTQFGVEVLRESAQQLRTGLFTSATAFFMDIKAAYKDKNTDAEKDVIARYCKPQTLIIDEMSKRGETEWENRLLFHLINERYNEDLDTLMMANQDKDEFIESIGPAMTRRLNETGGLIECKWSAFV
jgi:DNA replication protein DnaC